MTAKVLEIHPESENEISTYFHCKRCAENVPPGMSPSDYQEITDEMVQAGYMAFLDIYDDEYATAREVVSHIFKAVETAGCRQADLVDR